MPSLTFIIIFHIFDISNSIFFSLSILPVFLIFSNYIFFTFSILPIFLIFFISHFLFPSFHTFNFSNSHFPSFCLSHTNSFSPIPSIIPFLLSLHVSFHLTSFFPNSTSLYNFPNRTHFVSLQLRFPHFTSFPLTSRCPRSSNFLPLLTYCVGNVPSVVPYHLSPILPVPCNSCYFISLNYSFLCYFFPFKNFLYSGSSVVQ